MIDASGQLIFPGGVDAHVHMELPFMGTESSDDFETGTAAGVAGGHDLDHRFRDPYPRAGAARRARDVEREGEEAVSDYAFHMAVTWFGDDTLEKMAVCYARARHPSFKTFMAYRGAIGVDDPELIQVMEAAKGLGALVTVHAEHGDAVVALQKKLLKEGKTHRGTTRRAAPRRSRARRRGARSCSPG